MATKPFGSDPDSYGARLRAKGIQVNRAGMVQHNGKPPAPHRYNQWEKGIAGEDRANGTRMPFLDSSGDLIGVKPMSEGKHRKGLENLDRMRREAAATTTGDT